MADETPFHTMRQRLVDRGYLDSDFRLTAAGNAYSLEVMANVAAREPKSAKVAQWVKEWPAPEPRERPTVRSMGSPDYTYQPHSDERRAKMSAAQRERLGIPAGHRRVYGVNVPDAAAEVLRPLATEIAGKRGAEEATAFVLAAQANGWRHDPAKVPEKKKNVWTPERRQMAAEAAAAMHARRRAAKAEASKAQPKQTEEVVNAQTQVAPAPRDSGLREIHGVTCIDPEKVAKRIVFVERNNYVAIETGYDVRLLTVAQARYAAARLLDLAGRLSDRLGPAA